MGETVSRKSALLGFVFVYLEHRASGETYPQARSFSFCEDILAEALRARCLSAVLSWVLGARVDLGGRVRQTVHRALFALLRDW